VGLRLNRCLQYFLCLPSKFTSREAQSYCTKAFRFMMTQIYLPFALLSGIIALLIHRTIRKNQKLRVCLPLAKYTHTDKLKGRRGDRGAPWMSSASKAPKSAASRSRPPRADISSGRRIAFDGTVPLPLPANREYS
jgi:hypothetical protein